MSEISRKNFLGLGSLAAAGLATGCSAGASSAGVAADQIVVNGLVLTQDDAMPNATAFAVKGGRFIAVGSDADIRNLAAAGTEVIDAGGATVVPGFIDAHSHPSGAGLNALKNVNTNLGSVARIQEALRERASDVGADQEEWAYPKEVVAEARKRRDAERAQHAHERARLAMVSDERKKTSKQIDRLVATAAAAAATEPAASDAADELPDDPEVLEKEIKAMRRQEVRLQAAVPKLEETRFFLEKVRNERRDVGRRVRANQAEVNSLEAQLATKAEQLQELQELAQPSAVTQHYQTETKRLQRAVSELAAKRVSSEREISKQGQRLERVRSVMSSFLKAQQLPKARPLQLPAYNPLQPLTTPHNPSHKPLTTF